LTGSDAETAAANLTFTVTLPPAHGTLSGSGANLTFNPTAGFSGLDSFQFKVTDRGKPDNCGAPGPTCAAALDSAVATVSITVNQQLRRVGMPGPLVIGMDKISVKKGPEYRIVVSDLLRRRAIWFGGENRQEESMDLFYRELGPGRAAESAWP
jgi:hypothetical protein